MAVRTTTFARAVLLSVALGFSGGNAARADELAEFLFWNEMGNATDQAVQSYTDYQRERQLWRDKAAAAKAELERCGGCASAKAELDKWQGIENQFQHVAGALFAATGTPPIIGKWLGIDIPPTPGLSPAERERLCRIERRPWVSQRSEFCQSKIDEHLACLRGFQKRVNTCYVDAATRPGEACYWSSKFYELCYSENYRAVELEKQAQEARAAGRIIPEYVDDGSVKIVFYGLVPDDFLPRLPPPELAAKLNDNKRTEIKFRMQRSRDGLLRQATIAPFGWDDVVPDGRCFEPGAVTDEIEMRVCEDVKEMSFLHRPLLLSCSYTGHERALTADAMYWYGARPVAPVADPRNYLKRSRNHPLSMVLDARSDCPATLDEANSTRTRFRASLASLGVDETPGDVPLRSSWNAELRAQQESELAAERTEKLASFPIEGVFEATFATEWVDVRGSQGIRLRGASRKSAGECAIRKINEVKFELTCREPYRTALAEIAGEDHQQGQASSGTIRKFSAHGVIEKGYLVVHWTPEVSIPYAVDNCQYDRCLRLRGYKHSPNDSKLGRDSIKGELIRKGDLNTWNAETRLDELPELSSRRSHRLVLQQKGIESLEKFAALSDTEIAAFMPVYRELREAAREYLNAKEEPPLTLTGVWKGRYTCKTGPVALELKLRETGDGRVWGTFAFSALPDNPQVKSGSFYVRGRKHDYRRRVELSPGPWIDQPQGYSTIGLCGRYASPRQGASEGPATHIWGLMTSIGHHPCKDFQVQRVDDDAASLGDMPHRLQVGSGSSRSRRLSNRCDGPLPELASDVYRAKQGRGEAAGTVLPKAKTERPATRFPSINNDGPPVIASPREPQAKGSNRKSPAMSGSSDVQGEDLTAWLRAHDPNALRVTASSVAFGADNTKAIDGSTEGDNRVWNHTRNGSDEWLQVDLGAEYRISGMEIHNRHKFGSRLNGAVVELRDSTGGIVAASAPITGASDGSKHGFVADKVARYVRIRHSKQFLHVTEVKVYVPSRSTPPAAATARGTVAGDEKIAEPK